MDISIACAVAKGSLRHQPNIRDLTHQGGRMTKKSVSRFCLSAILYLPAVLLRKVPIEGSWYRHQLVQLFFWRACVQMLILYAISFVSFSVSACIVANLTRVCKPSSRFFILVHFFSVLFRTELCAVRISR